jgi:hypothetical protein
MCDEDGDMLAVTPVMLISAALVLTLGLADETEENLGATV